MHDIEELFGVFAHGSLEHQAHGCRTFSICRQSQQGPHKWFVQPRVPVIFIVVVIIIIIISAFVLKFIFALVLFAVAFLLGEAEEPGAGEEDSTEEGELADLVRPVLEEGLCGERLATAGVLSVNVHNEGGTLLVCDVEIGPVEEGDDLPPVEGGVDGLEGLCDDGGVPLARPVWLRLLRSMLR